MADATPGLALSNVQKAVLTWSQAECVGELEESKSLGNQSVWYIEPPAAAVDIQDLTTSNITVSRRHLAPRADCRTATVNAGDGCYNVAQRCGISQSDLLKYNGGGNFCSALIPDQKVCCSSGTLPSSGPPPNADGTCAIKRAEAGDSCASLAVKCGIPGATFDKYNSGASFCSTLRVGQAVCCSSGKLADLRPKKKEDGSCFDYTVQPGDFCDSIAAYHSLTADELKSLNKNTWGFTGCENMWSGVKLCLSEGSPPMPAPIANAVCGPQKPDTKTPSDRSLDSLAKLNPCPLNVCCNNWGQCGTTIEFCEKPKDNAKPGTKPGCVSNCGMDIVNNGQAPLEFRRVGYFEAWNANRPCLHMDIEQFNRNDYTHVHYAFIDLTADFQVDTSRHQDQFDKFVKLKGVKRVAAFGGWAASTEPGTFWIFREGVKAQNRQKLADNLAEFIWKYDLDGLDVDWEYPGAPDIPGIPPADPIDGQNYLNLLSILRTRLATKSLSIALPASYWYLRAFPVEQIYKVVDYMVYMTYDLHGQWDYDNKWSSPGCPAGNCLRSHVNMTETMDALSMITKAGVPSYKILVGVTSYGRSFQMTTPGCTGPMCTFTGKASGATPGRCTGEASYLANAEINEILAGGRGSLFRDNSESDIVVYDNDQWVSYMTDREKASRTEKWKGLNFGGTSDWAVDLRKFGPAPGVALPVTDGGDWRLQTCNNPAIEDTAMPGKKRWETMGADKAWKDMVTDWENYRDVKKGPKSFVRFMADYYHFPAENTCGTLTDPYVCGPFFCSDFEGKAGTGPAAALVMNALGQVGKFMASTYNGIEAAKNNVPQNKFMTTFAKAKTDDQLALFILINALALGFTAGLAPVFNNMMKSVPGSVKDNAKDISFAAIGFGASTAKDVIGSIDQSNGNHIEGMIKKYYEFTSKSVDETLGKMFSGEQDSIKFLGGLISEGKMTPSCPTDAPKNSCKEPAGSVSKEDMRKAWETALYGYLIPQAWRLNDVNPVVVWTNEACDAVGVGTGLFGYVSASDAEWARGCWENNLAYLLHPNGKAQYQGQWNSWYPSKMPPPPGLDSIKNGEWTGVTVDDMIYSAIAWTWRHGNRKNKEEWDKDRSFKTQDNFDQMWGVVSKDKSVVRTPGLIDIPVCVNDVVWDNWFKHSNDRWYSWPCAP